MKGQYGKLILLSRGDQNPTRLGISISKQVGNATVRNKMKRRVREAFRSQLESVGDSFDIVYVVWKPDVAMSELSKEVAGLLAMATKSTSQPR
jgi:ribonuclease P protein component